EWLRPAHCGGRFALSRFELLPCHGLARMLTLRLHALTLILLALTGAAGVRGDDPPAPKGDVSKHSFAKSKVFPGTVRDYWIYVPKQYDPAKPACLWVNQDGIQFNAPTVFDQLIHKKEMPVTIGVFVRPGVVKAPSATALDRFNRSYE